MQVKECFKKELELKALFLKHYWLRDSLDKTEPRSHDEARAVFLTLMQAPKDTSIFMNFGNFRAELFYASSGQFGEGGIYLYDVAAGQGRRYVRVTGWQLEKLLQGLSPEGLKWEEIY